MHDVFTSAAACDAIARRTIRVAGRHNMGPIEMLREVTAPIARAIAQRGKLPMDMMGSSFHALLARLRDTVNIIDLDTGIFRTRKLSYRDVMMARFVMVMSEDEEESLHLLTCELLLSRRDLQIRTAGTEFRVGSHVLSRFMQREQKDIRHFFAGATATLRAATVLGPLTLFTETGSLAVPFRDGLLLGSAGFCPVERFPRVYPLTILFDRNGWSSDLDEMPLLIPGHVPIMDMRTFIDGDSLSPRRERLRDALLAWQEGHPDGISALSSAMLFGGAPLLPGVGADALREIAQSASAAARELVRSDTWRDGAEPGPAQAGK